MELILHGLGTALMSNFRAIDRETGFLLPPSVDEWLSEKRLARFVVEVIDGLDLWAIVQAIAVLVRLPLIRHYIQHSSYGYTTGLFSAVDWSARR